MIRPLLPLLLLALLVLLGGGLLQHYERAQGLERELDVTRGAAEALRGSLGDARSEVRRLQDETLRLNRDMASLNRSLENTRSALGTRDSEARDLGERVSELTRRRAANLTLVGTVSRRGGGDQGVAFRVRAELRHGKGDILVNGSALPTGDALDRSLRDALRAAQLATGVPLGMRDMEATFEGNFTSVDGESAGLPLALLFSDLLQNRSIAPGTLATGTITAAGTVGKVSGIREKAQAASQTGATRLLVPPGEGVPVEGITLVEVRNLTEAMEIALGPLRGL
ncbi:MAG: hypothetical protein HY558_07425 [Euryarchaeota archaeon]|nr:hypothetical protein [Euryarchaeota archaeon]